MRKKTSLILSLLLSLCFVATLRAQISVGPAPTGSGVNAFDVFPDVASGWSTAFVDTTGSGAYTTAEALDAAVIANTDASTVATVLGSSTTQPPSQSATARYNSAGFYVQTRPTGNDYLILMATLRNDSGADQTAVTISYDWDQKNANPVNESIPGHRVYVSLTGAPGSWILVPELSTFTTSSTAQALTGTVALGGTWAQSALIYVIWVDDNGPGGTTNPQEGAYTIDNISFVPSSGTIPLTVSLTSPANNAVVTTPGTVTISANSGGTTPATSVSFYVNDVLLATDTTAPFSTSMVNPTAGTYQIYAMAQNGTETAYSQTNTITVRNEFVDYTGDPVGESFDNMQPDGTQTPIGWYVSAAPPINSTTVTAGDGSAGPSSTILGWNYGNPDDENRALGTAPTGGERNIAVRIRNMTSSNITAFTFTYDGEVWRNYTNAQFGLTNMVSYDNGATWTTTGFDFIQPIEAIPGTAGAVNGDVDPNRTAGIGGRIVPPTPIAPGGVLIIRWFDANEGGTDGGLAVDNFLFSAEFEQFMPFVLITSPAEGANFAEAAPITITASATMNNPVTNVAFFRDGGTLIGNDATAPFSAVYSNSTVGAHTLTATAFDNAGNTITTTNVVNITVNPNQVPTVTVATPITETNVGAAIAGVTATASDPDGTIVRVEFYLNNVLSATDTTSPYTATIGNPFAGNLQLSAVAVDNAGGRATNSTPLSITNPPNVTLLVTNTSEWKYLDNGTDPGAGWETAGFSDSLWLSGFAELGYGDAPARQERTTVSFGPESTNKYITTYFRKTLNVVNPSAFGDLTLNVLRDDGAVVYINGNEVWRSYMPEGEVITPLTLATNDPSDDGNIYQVATIPSTVLQAGQNLIAVEIHQTSITSSDISFDLMLWGNGSAGPRLTITRLSGSQVEISWGADATGYSLQSNTDVGNPASWNTVQAVSGAGSIIVNSGSGLNFYRLRNP